MILECVVNVSEGRNQQILDEIGRAAGRALLDRHQDYFHHRSVFTLAATEIATVVSATEALAEAAIRLVDLSGHVGVHPRLGVVDVVPFVTLAEPPLELTEALEARARFATFASSVLALPCFYYGPERTLPEVRRHAFVDLSPDLGPSRPNPRSGSCCVGARGPLVAYNLVLAGSDLEGATAIARSIRSPKLRALGLALGDEVQVSCNLIEPFSYGPDAAYDEVAALASIARAELVGLVPEAVLQRIDPLRWPQLDLDANSSVEARLEAGIETNRR